MGEGGAVALRACEGSGGSGVVAFGDVEVTHHLAVALRTSATGQQGLCAGGVAVGQSQQGFVSCHLGSASAQALSLLDIVLCGGEITSLIGDAGKVIEGACVGGVELCGLLVPRFLGLELLLQVRSVEKLLEAQLTGVGSELFNDLLVGAADNLVVGDEACAVMV